MSLAVAAALLIGAAPASAQPPPWDNFADEFPVWANHTYDFDNIEATDEGDDRSSDCADQTAPANGFMFNTVWFRVLGTGDSMDVEVFDPDADMVVAVYNTAFSELDCMDSAGTGGDELATFDTNLGGTYFIQIGGFSELDEGAFGLDISSSTPPHDDRGDALDVDAGAPVVRDNLGATDDFDQVCEGQAFGDAPIGSTIWFRYFAPAQGDITLMASGLDTVIQVYRPGENSPIACNDESSEDTIAGPSRLVLSDAAPGEYQVQVGGFADQQNDELTFTVDFRADTDLDNDGASPPGDCDDNDPRRFPTANEVLNNDVDEDCRNGPAFDRDGDGALARPSGEDCDDNDPAVEPGNRDIPFNGKDDDCRNDGDAEGSVLPLGLDFDWGASRGRYVPVLKFIINPPNGSTVVFRCRGRRCPRNRTINASAEAVAARRINVKRRFKLRRVWAGQRIRLIARHPEHIGRRYVIRGKRNDDPSIRLRCLVPNRRGSIRCPN